MGRKLFWAMLAAALGAAFFTGCAQYRQQIKEMEKLAADRAQTHLWETYGGTAEILEVKVGTLQSGFHSVVDSDALVTVSLGEETFQVFVETAEPAFCRDNREGLALTRDLERLPKTGRPISQSTDLRQLWARREPLYRSFADVTADNNGSLEETLEQIEKELKAL